MTRSGVTMKSTGTSWLVSGIVPVGRTWISCTVVTVTVSPSGRCRALLAHFPGANRDRAVPGTGVPRRAGKLPARSVMSRRGRGPAAAALAGQGFAGGPDRRPLTGIQVLLDPGDVSVAHLQVHRGVQFDLGTARQLTAQDVLLQHAVGSRNPPDDVIAQARHRAVQALKDLQVLFGGLLHQVVVVPDDGVWGIDLAQRADVAGLEGGEETRDQFLVHRMTLPAIAAIVFSYPQSPPTGIGNRIGRSTPAVRYSMTRARHSSAPPCATNPSATCCGTRPPAPARSPASIFSRTPRRLGPPASSPNSRGVAGCST